MEKLQQFPVNRRKLKRGLCFFFISFTIQTKVIWPVVARGLAVEWLWFNKNYKENNTKLIWWDQIMHQLCIVQSILGYVRVRNNNRIKSWKLIQPKSFIFCDYSQVENWRRKAVEMCSSSNQLLAAGQFIFSVCNDFVRDCTASWGKQRSGLKQTKNWLFVNENQQKLLEFYLSAY